MIANNPRTMHRDLYWRSTSVRPPCPTKQRTDFTEVSLLEEGRLKRERDIRKKLGILLKSSRRDPNHVAEALGRLERLNAWDILQSAVLNTPLKTAKDVVTVLEKHGRANELLKVSQEALRNFEKQDENKPNVPLCQSAKERIEITSNILGSFKALGYQDGLMWFAVEASSKTPPELVERAIINLKGMMDADGLVTVGKIAKTEKARETARLALRKVALKELALLNGRPNYEKPFAHMEVLAKLKDLNDIDGLNEIIKECLRRLKGKELIDDCKLTPKERQIAHTWEAAMIMLHEMKHGVP
jgi:hypothetical protein